MKKYNFERAKQLIEKHPDAVSASLGMHEDWFWTAEEIWNKESGFVITDGPIGGINGSSWATPTLQLRFEDGTDKMIPCHDAGESDPITPLQRTITSGGCLSGPVQDNITPLSSE